MSTTFWIWSHLSFALLATVPLLPILRKQTSPPLQAVWFLVLALAGMVPYGQTDLSGFVLAHTGTLSATMLVLLTCQLLATWRLINPIEPGEDRAIKWGLAAIGLFLYPAAIGFLTADPYLLGYHSLLAWVTLTVSVIVVLRGHLIWGICLTVAVLGWKLQLHESVNLWDYLIDPWLWLVAMAQSSWSIFAVANRKKRSLTKFPEPSDPKTLSA